MLPGQPLVLPEWPRAHLHAARSVMPPLAHSCSPGNAVEREERKTAAQHIFTKDLLKLRARRSYMLAVVWDTIILLLPALAVVVQIMLARAGNKRALSLSHVLSHRGTFNW